MEVEGIKRMMERWKDDNRIVGCVHDNDAKSTKAINAIRPDMTQYYDPNHGAKCLERKWQRLAPKHLRGFKGKLLSWFHYLARSDFSDEEKTKYWLNAVEHFKGNHAGCPREHLNPAQSPVLTSHEAELELSVFLYKTVKYVVRTRTPFDQQMCESFNAVKAQFASKSISWKVSWSCRVMCAVMPMNCGGNWKLQLAEECGIDLSDETRERLTQRYAKDLAQNDIRRRPEKQQKEAQRRRHFKQTARLNRIGADDYRLPLVSVETAIQVDRTLAPHEEDLVLEDPEEQIVPVDPDAFPAHRSALPVPELPEYTPPAAAFIIPLTLPSTHWVSPPTGDYGSAPHEADESDTPEEEDECDALPQIPVFLEDDPSGVEFRVVIEEGG
jgi:hypothetical protein